MLLFALASAQPALGASNDHAPDAVASKYAVVFAEKAATNRWDMASVSSEFGDRVEVMYKEKGDFSLVARIKGLKCRDRLFDYGILYPTELRWKNGELNAAQRAYASKEIFDKKGRPHDAFLYLREKCGVSLDAVAQMHRVIRDELGYHDQYPPHAPHFPYE